MAVPKIAPSPAAHLIGSVYHFVNRQWSIDWVGPFERFLEARQDKTPNGTDVCNSPDTVIRAKKLVVSFDALLVDRSDPPGVAELARVIDAYRDPGTCAAAPAASPVGESLTADVLL